MAASVDAVVAGAGGFIGGHLVASARSPKARPFAPSTSSPSTSGTSVHGEAESRPADLADRGACREAVGDGAGEVYNLAADMGGMGFIENNKAAVHALGADQHPHAHGRQGSRASVASSTPPPRASTPATSRPSADIAALKEEDAYPADARGRLRLGEALHRAHGRHFREDFGLETRVARYHNVYGPHGTWDGGREKAPAAICRKIAMAALTGRARDRDLGRRRADPQLHLHRRLRRGHRDVHPRRRRPSRSTSAPPSWSRSTSCSTWSPTSPAIDVELDARPRRPPGRARPQQRQHADPEAATAGSRPSACATAWRRPTPGSATRSRPSSPVTDGRPQAPPRRRPRRRRLDRRPGDGAGRGRPAGSTPASAATCASPACTASWRPSATPSCSPSTTPPG